MQFARPLRHLRRHGGADPWLHEIAVVGEVDLRYPGGGCKPPLVLGRIAAHGANILKRALLATHDPFAAREFRIRGIGGFCFESRLIKPRRKHINKIDIA